MVTEVESVAGLVAVHQDEAQQQPSPPDTAPGEGVGPGQGGQQLVQLTRGCLLLEVQDPGGQAGQGVGLASHKPPVLESGQ